MVVVIDTNQVTQLQVTGGRGSLSRNTLHETSISEEHICVVVNQVIPRLVVDSSGVCLGDGKTYSIGETLTKRTGGNLNTGGIGLLILLIVFNLLSCPKDILQLRGDRGSWIQLDETASNRPKKGHIRTSATMSTGACIRDHFLLLS